MSDQQLMLDQIKRAIVEDSFYLNPIECSLLETVQFSLSQGWDISDGQGEKLERIWKRAIGHDE